MKEKILKYALQNAVKFKGKANPGAIIGKLFSEDPKLKAKAGELGKEISNIVKEVNAMKLEEQIAKLEKVAPELLNEKKEVKKKDLPELKGVKMGSIVTRIAPEPSKYPHVGHALSFLINYMYAKKYGGKCIVRYEDTNPEKAKKEFYDVMDSGLEWLGIKADKKLIVSNDMPKMYKYAEKLINDSQAYVCFCSRDKMSEYRQKGMICDCRNNPKEENIDEWKNMLDRKYKEGECVLRLKGIPDDPNMVMRDPVLFRLSYAKHPIQGMKYGVWPMYDFENAVEEELCGITHVFRSNEFGEMRVELQNYIKKLLGFKIQFVKQYGRFNVIGAVTQGREIREMIEKKKVLGWDDPRLVTLLALKRRGIKPEVLYELVKEAGMSPKQTNLSWDVISAISRKLLDAEVNRYFFVENPVKLKVKNAPKKIAKLELHPDFPKRGNRSLKTNGEFYISDKLSKSKNYRLMHLLNFKNGEFVSEKHDPKLKATIIHWLPVGETIDVEVFMPNGKWIKGVGEKSLEKLKENEVVQFERFGFVKLDKKLKNKLQFWFTHE